MYKRQLFDVSPLVSCVCTVRGDLPVPGTNSTPRCSKMCIRDSRWGVKRDDLEKSGDLTKMLHYGKSDLVKVKRRSNLFNTRL